MKITLEDVIDLFTKRFDSIDARLLAVEGGLRETKRVAYDIQDEVGAINTAIENDAKRYFDHDKRIARLEKARA